MFLFKNFKKYENIYYYNYYNVCYNKYEMNNEINYWIY